MDPSESTVLGISEPSAVSTALPSPVSWTSDSLLTSVSTVVKQNRVSRALAVQSAVRVR